MTFLIKDQEKQRWKYAMKNFSSYSQRNEEALFVHNATNSYRVCNNREMIDQFKVFGEKGLEFYQDNIRKFTYKKKDYVMITINGENVMGSDGEKHSAMAFALNFMVCGYTYLFKKHSWEELEKDMKNEKFGIKYIKKKKNK